MKFVIGLGALVCLLLLSIYLWFSGAPTTQLMDSSGAPLMAAADAGPEAGREQDQLFDFARTLLASGSFSQAKLELMRLLREEQQDGLACVLLSRATRELKQVDEAVDYGLKAVQLLPEDAPAHLAYARALGVQLMAGFQGVGGVFKALPRIKRFKSELALVVQYDPMDTEARTMQVFAAMAPVVGDSKRALEVAKEIEAIDGLLGKKMLAYAYSHKGDAQRAMAVCREAGALYPTENGFALILAGVLREEKRFAEAREAFARVRSIGPANEDYHLSMIKQAEMQIEQGMESEEALELVQDFIAARPVGDWIPTRAEAKYLLGAAQLKLGRLAEAKQAFRASLALQPEHKRSTKALGRLE